MTDFISTLADRTGIEPGLAQSGLGALLSMLQERIPHQTFTSVYSSIPNAKGLLNGFQSKSESALPGVGRDFAEQPSGAYGGKPRTATRLVRWFSAAGFSVDTLRVFLPAVFELLRERVSPDVMQQIEGGLPDVTSIFEGPDPRGLMDKFKTMF